MTALMWALAQNNLETIRLLLSHTNIDVNLQMKNGASALMWSVRNNRIAIIYLVSQYTG